MHFPGVLLADVGRVDDDERVLLHESARVVHHDLLDLAVHAFERKVPAEPVLDLLRGDALVQHPHPGGELHVPAGLDSVEGLPDELDGRLVKMGRKSPQESLELLVRFERNYAIIHGVGFVFCWFSSLHCTMEVNGARPTLCLF